MNYRLFLHKLFFIFLLTFAFSTVNAQVNPPGLNLIKAEDLKKDLYTLADAHFRGRSAGTLDELKAASWLGEQFRKIGLQPAGDDGSYLQYFTLWRNIVSEHSVIELNNQPLVLWKDVAVSQMANAHVQGTVLFFGDALSIDTNKVDVKNKIVALVANPKGINLDVSLPTWRYSRYIYTKYGAPLVRHGAAAVIFIADAVAEAAWEDALENFKRGTYDIDGGPNENVAAKVPVLWMHATAKSLFDQPVNFNLQLLITKYGYPSVNVVGIAPGKDAKLKSEYLLYSGHSDAHGIRNAIKGDSVYYGADDNGSVCVGMLATARAFIKFPGKRSVLFVIHGAEERGLLGSRFYASHPTVPVENIAAVLNGDMIGRNNTDSAALLGVKPPHLNSPDLVNWALAANNEGPKFKLDFSWDDPAQIEGWYFRSDHLPYARLGIPAIYFSSLLHPDYHTPSDNAQNINYPKLLKMTQWIYRIGWKVVNADQRPAKQPGFKLER